MKEILREICSKIAHPHNRQVFYSYDEVEHKTSWGKEHHFYILEKSKYSNSVTRIVFAKHLSVSTVQLDLFKVPIDIVEMARKELLKDVVSYGVFSAIDHIDKFKNDQTANSK